MRKTLVVVVIAGAACWGEPAPQTPANTRTAEHVTPPPVTPPPVKPPPVGRIKVDTQRTHQPLDLEKTFGPVIASGTDAGRPWFLRGSIDASGAATYVQTGSGGGSGGKGALPFQDLRWKKLGHFGSVGSGEHSGIGFPRTFTLKGVVSKQTAAIDVQLDDGSSLSAQIIDTGDARASFFVVVWSTPAHWDFMVARDAAGAVLETYRQPPSQATATPAGATSTP